MRTAMQSFGEKYLGRRGLGHLALLAGVLVTSAACGDDDDDNDSAWTTGGTGGTYSGSGGNSSGGKNYTSGGRTSGGQGNRSGGTTGSGGAKSGGSANSGGTNAGGTTDTGGSSSGGAVTAGTAGAPAGAGGADDGTAGITGTGGLPASGGAPPSGGSNPGGAAGEAGNGEPLVTGGTGTGGGGGGVAGSAGAAGAAPSPGGAAGQGGQTAVTPPAPLMMYVACADNTGSIQQYTLDREAWTIAPNGTYTTGSTNSWVTLNAAKDMMYVNSRTSGLITTLSRDTDTGALDVVDTVGVPMEPPGAGGAPAVGNPATQVIALDPSEQYLLAANYTANYVYVYGMQNDGTVGDIVGSAEDGIASHQIVFVPGSTLGSVLVPYRTSDVIDTYRFGAADGSLTFKHSEEVDLDGDDATTGPRHIVFHPTTDNWLYVVNEIAGTIDMFRYSDTTGNLTKGSSISSVPPTYTGTDKFASEIAIAPSGNFVYVSNRYSTQANFTDAGSIGVFAVNPVDGSLTAVEFESSRGALPRHFMLSNDGAALVAGNQNSSNIAVFSADTETGELEFKFTRDVCGTPFFVQLLDD